MTKEYANISKAIIKIKDDKCPKCNETMLSNKYGNLYVSDCDSKRNLEDMSLSDIYFYRCPKCYDTYERMVLNMRDKLQLYATGIIVDYGYAGHDKYGWSAKIYWDCLEEHMTDKSMKGHIGTSYYVESIQQAIDQVLELMNRFGIMTVDGVPFSLYRRYEDQAESINEIMRNEAKKRGWQCYF